MNPIFIKIIPLSPPRASNLSILERLISVYKLWHEFVQHFPKKFKYTLGNKIDFLFIETLDFIFTASHIARDQKLPIIQKASTKLDLLKFFLQISWELKALDNRHYILLSEPLNEIGRMMGGWIRQVENG